MKGRMIIKCSALLLSLKYSIIISLVVLLSPCAVEYAHGQQFTPEVSKFAFSEKCGEIHEIPGDARTLTPWNVAIFRRTNAKSDFKFINSGVLISNKTILTVFGGVYGASVGGRKYFIPAPETFLVAVGLNSTSLSTADKFTQMRGVSYIIPYRYHEADNQMFHFWLYHLTEPFRLNTPYAKTPCLPFFLSKLPHQWHLLHGGFTTPLGSSGFSELKVKTSVAVPDRDCANLFRKNYGGESAAYVWCTRMAPQNLTSETENLCFTHGSVVVTRVVNRYFLAGLTALIPDKKMGQCTQDTTYIHAKTMNTIEWMFSNIRCGSNGFSCVNSTCIPLNQVCNHAQSCPDDDMSDEDPIFCQAQNRCRRGSETVQCGVRGSCIRPDQLCDGNANCPDGGDEDYNFCFPPNPLQTKRHSNSPIHRQSNQRQPNQTPLALITPLSSGRSPNYDDPQPQPITDEKKEHSNLVNAIPNNNPKSKCIPLPISEGAKVTCKNLMSNQTIDCSEATEQVVATITCDKYYSPKFRIPSIQMTCTPSGTWQPFRPFACQSNCGILSSQVTALITHGLETSRKNSFPWHVALFREKENNSEQLVYVCGGSLIERKFILTAAHCVDDIVKSPHKSSKYRVVLAPLSTNFEDNLGDKLAQIHNIKVVKVPSDYDYRSLRSDIAIVQLQESAELGQHIRPVCYLQESSRFNPMVGQLGKVPGFGLNENGETSYFLKFANLPVVSKSDCSRNLPREVPASTFCAGYNNGTSLCRGDSGGGIVFPGGGGEYERYNLKGIVSAEASDPASSKCGTSSYSIFTHVDTFRDWILQTLDMIEP